MCSLGRAPVRHPPRDVHAGLLEARDLVGVVGHERDRRDAEVAQDRRRQFVAAQDRRRSRAARWPRRCRRLRPAARRRGSCCRGRCRAPPAAGRRRRRGRPRSIAASARSSCSRQSHFERAERLAGPALGVHARQHRLGAAERRHVARDDRHVLALLGSADPPRGRPPRVSVPFCVGMAAWAVARDRCFREGMRLLDEELS